MLVCDVASVVASATVANLNPQLPSFPTRNVMVDGYNTWYPQANIMRPLRNSKPHTAYIPPVHPIFPSVEVTMTSTEVYPPKVAANPTFRARPLPFQKAGLNGKQILVGAFATM